MDLFFKKFGVICELNNNNVSPDRCQRLLDELVDVLGKPRLRDTLMIKLTCFSLSLTLLILAGCSDYPSDARITTDARISSAVQAWSGEVLEFDADIRENLLSQQEISESFTAFKVNPTSLPEFANVAPEAVRSALKQIQQKRLEHQAALTEGYNYWKSQQQSGIDERRAKLAEFDSKVAKYQAFVTEAQARLETATQTAQKIEQALQEVNSAVVEHTNEFIVNRQLAIRKLNVNSSALSWRSSTWRDGVDLKDKSCEHQEGFVTLDHIGESRSCIYINRPVDEIASSEYDQFLREQTSRYLELKKTLGDESGWKKPATGLRAEVQTAEEAIKKAHILAENQTGLNQHQMQRERKKLQGELDSRVADLVAREEQVAAGDYPYFVTAEVDVSLSDTYDLDRVVYEHLSNLRNQIVADSLVERTPISQDGTVSGLSGSGAYLIVVAEAGNAYESGSGLRVFDADSLKATDGDSLPLYVEDFVPGSIEGHGGIDELATEALIRHLNSQG